MTWSDLEIFHSDGENTIGNIAPVLEKESGVIFAPFTRNNREVWMSKSLDDGLTWSAPFEMPDMRNDDWIWVGLGPPAGLQLDSGRLLIPGYHNTMSMGNGSSLGSGFTKGHTMLSDDQGESWRIGSEEVRGDGRRQASR
jgi:sialidase-1